MRHAFESQEQREDFLAEHGNDAQVCSICRQEKPLTAFSKATEVRSTGVRYWTIELRCRECRRRRDLRPKQQSLIPQKFTSPEDREQWRMTQRKLSSAANVVPKEQSSSNALLCGFRL